MVVGLLLIMNKWGVLKFQIKNPLFVVVMTSSDDDEQFLQVRKRIKHNTSSVESGIYLDTVNRQMLDFDFEKVCSVSLSNLNVYACLVCGKYFQGKSRAWESISAPTHPPNAPKCAPVI